MTDDTALKQEAVYLHGAFFGTPPPEEVIERYVAANRLCLPLIDAASSRRIAAMVALNLDVEAIELVLRWRRLDTALTRKIEILFYLVEVRAAYYAYFIGYGTGRVQAYFGLTASAAQTIWKFLKGTYLIWRHGLV